MTRDARRRIAKTIREIESRLDQLDVLRLHESGSSHEYGALAAHLVSESMKAKEGDSLIAEVQEFIALEYEQEPSFSRMEELKRDLAEGRLGHQLNLLHGTQEAS